MKFFRTTKELFKNFAIFRGKHECGSRFLIKLQPFSPAILQRRCFLLNMAKFLQNTSGAYLKTQNNKQVPYLLLRKSMVYL